MEGAGCGSVHERVGGVEVGDQGSHGSLLSKRHSVIPPHTAPGVGAGREGGERERK